MKLENYQPKIFIENVKKFLAPFFMMFAVALAVLTPIIAAKIIQIGPIKFTANLLLIMLVYGIIDMINELWGKKTAQATAIFIVFIRFLIYVTIIPIINYLPTAFAPAGFSKLLTFTLKSLVAAEIAVIISTLIVDIPIFSWLKMKKGVPFFIRTNVSGIIAALVATVVFVTITYWGTNQNLLQLTITQMIARLIFAISISFITTFIVTQVKKRKLN